MITNAVTRQLAESLGETERTPIQTIDRIVTHLGATFALDMLAQTQQIEAGGGMSTRDGARRRTPGGVFFALVRQRLQEEGRKEVLRVIFPGPAPRMREPRRRPEPVLVAPLRPRRKGMPLPAQSLTAAAAPQPARLNQAEILMLLDRHLGNLPDLYRRSLDMANATVTLHFHFPAVAQTYYGEAVAQLARETGMQVLIAPQPHQQALMAAVRTALPAATVQKIALRQDTATATALLMAPLEAAALDAAQAAFTAQTGWNLAVETAGDVTPLPAAEPTSGSMELNTALQIARALLPPETGCLRVGADANAGMLTIRFAFPDVARVQYAETLAELARRTGWAVRVAPEPHQGALTALAQEMLTEAGLPVRRVAVYRETRTIQARVSGDIAARESLASAFRSRTGWTLELQKG